MAKKSNEPEKKEYILKPGYTHNGFDDEGNRHEFVGGQKDNDRVFLTESQAAQFKDRFESLEDLKERQKLESELAKNQKDMAKIRAALEEKGMSLDDLIASAESTTKKPDPSPPVGTPEPAPADVTPAPVGSTPNPVNAKK